MDILLEFVDKNRREILSF